jgi:DNA-binding CsgD family transcriptional regulator
MAAFSTARARQERMQRLGVTRREAEVLGLVAAPFTNAQIAARLGVSKRTVESHVSALLRKFAVVDRASLIRASGQLPEEAAPASAPINQPSYAHQHWLHSVPVGLAVLRSRIAMQRQQTEQQRAIRLQADAITFHDAAARRLDELAATWDERARAVTDANVRANALDLAGIARERADAARRRAAVARQRRQPEG